jgi:nucleolar protein 56
MGQLAYFAKVPVGIFVVSHSGDLLYYKLFSRQPAKAVEEFLLAGEKDARQRIAAGAEFVESPAGYKLLRKQIRKYAKSLGFVENDAELNEFLSSFASILSRKRLLGLITRDRLLVQAVNAYDDLHRMTNALEERVYEWFSLHYPEIDRKGVVSRIAEYGRRENFPNFRESTGVEFSAEDEKTIASFALSIIKLEEEKKKIESYARGLVRELAPNMASLVDEILAARLVALAGSLEKLSKLPASAVQLLGAEKALFRHLHKKGRSPKYGIIFMTPYIQNASPDKKGKAARVLASKLMQACRIDFYSGRSEPRLRQDLDEEMRKI